MIYGVIYHSSLFKPNFIELYKTCTLVSCKSQESGKKNRQFYKGETNESNHSRDNGLILVNLRKKDIKADILEEGAS